jgi:hypothetical protein
VGRVGRGESKSGAEEVKMMLTLYGKWRERRERERREGLEGPEGPEGRAFNSASERDGGKRIEALTETGNEGEPLEEWKEGTEIRPQIYN